jgi:hypothetical protein
MLQRAFTLRFHAIAEDRPGPALQRQFERMWPSYRSWFEREGGAARPSYALGSRMLRRHMPELLPTYKRTLLDKSADYATVRVAPDREALIGRIAVSANSHWPEHLWRSQMTLREQYQGASIVSPGETLERFVERFLYPPVHHRPSLGAWGTLYTACYEPGEGAVEFFWPGRRLRPSF